MSGTSADQIALKLIENAYGMWRFRWTALLVAWVVAALGWAMVVALPNQYDAEAQVYVDTDSALKPLLTGLSVSTDTMNQVSMITRALLSRPQLEKVVASTTLKDRAKSTSDVEGMLERLARTILVSKIPGENIYKIWYRDSDPDTAHDVVQALLTNLMESSFRMDESDTAQAQEFLEDQIAAYEQRLTEAEEKLAEFKKANVGMMPGEGGDYYVRLQKSEAAVRELQTQVDAAEQARAEIDRQLSGEEPTFGLGTPGVGSGSASTSVDATIEKFQRQLDQLLLSYTDKHPDVVSVRTTLEDLYRVRDEERSARSGISGPSAMMGVEMNPVYQEMRKQKSRLDVEVVSLRAQLRERQATVTYLKRMVNTIPEVEAQLNRLARDYNVVKAQYEALLQRLESARLGDEVRKDSEDVTFDIVEPPRVPLLPSGPDRAGLSIVVFLFALAVAVGLTFLLNYSKPVFFSSSHLASVTGLPVYGTVGLSVSAQARRPGLTFALAGAAFFTNFIAFTLFGRRAFDLLLTLVTGA